MRHLNPKKIKHKIVISGLTLIIFVAGFILVNIKTNSYPQINKKLGEVAAVTSAKFLNSVSLVGAAGLSPYQTVNSNVAISGNVTVSPTYSITAPTFVGALSGNATTATSLSGNSGKTGKESRLYRSDAETSYNYYIRHYWTGNSDGWRITASNDIGDEQANIHRVSVNQADFAHSVDCQSALCWNSWNYNNYFQTNGDIYMGWAGNWMSTILAGKVGSGSSPTFQDTYVNSWFRLNGNGGLYSQNYHIGWQIIDSGWLRAYSDSGISNTSVFIPASGQLLLGNSLSLSGNRSGWTDRGCTGCAESVNGNPNLWLTAQNQVYVRSPNWNANDVAELYPITDNADTADLVSIAQTANGFAMKKSSTAYDQSIAGVISDNPAILFDGSGLIIGWKPDGYSVQNPLGNDAQEVKALQDLKEQHKGKKPVALSGRIPFKVSSINGTIKQGDPITSSDIPGVGMKATRAGQIIGKALENFDGSKATPCSDNPQYQCSKITVFVNVSWFDPDVTLTSTDGFSLDFDQLRDAGNNLITRIGAYAEIIVGKIQAGIIETKKLMVNGVDILGRLDAQQKEIDTLKQEIENLKNK